jgi:hypothetical protein
MDKKLFIVLFFSFIAATIIGTVSHEFGHYIVAKYFGYDTQIHYASTSWHYPDPNNPIVTGYPIAITLGGPIQTMFTGTIGIVILFLSRNSFFQADKLSFRQWFIIFISLFWLRQTANLCTWLGSYFVNGKLSSRGDEIHIANYYHLPNWTVVTTTAIIGTLLLAIIIFKFIPLGQRSTFLSAGLTGGIAGYIFWLVLFGKYIMP